MLGVLDEQTGVVWFSFDGPTCGGIPTAWRSDLVSVLRSFHDGPQPDDVVIAAGELVSNAVEHGGGVRRLHVHGRRGAVTVEVEDFRSSLARLHDVASKPDGARGLQIVEAVADDWGWWPAEFGKTVWATFRPEGDGPSPDLRARGSLSPVPGDVVPRPARRRARLRGRR